MTHRLTILAALSTLVFSSCESQGISKEDPKTTVEKPVIKEPHQYGGWYCPDNFGFAPVNIQELDQVPAISGRLPTKEELKNHASLIEVDLMKHPDAHALDMELPRLARIYSREKAMDELIIVIQAIVINEDTIIGYRFPNGGNGSDWLSRAEFLSDDEIDKLGSQPFYYSKTTLKATKEDIWRAIIKTPYAKEIGIKFGREPFFSTEWSIDAQAQLSLNTDQETAVGYVGTVYGNFYLQIDYDRNGFHYSEKILMIENPEEHTTELHVVRGPFPKDFKQQKSNLDQWVADIVKASELR